MAVVIPSLSTVKPWMTGGEKRLGERLEQKLDDDYWIWYDIPIGAKQRHPDFMIFHPARGLLVLEVKDWGSETIQHLNKSEVILQLPAGQKTVQNPLLQARTYVHYAVRLLQRDRALLTTAGQLKVAYGYGVVFANLTRNQFAGLGMGEVFPLHLVLCKDEMTESVDAEVFQKRLWDMFPYPMAGVLSPSEMDRLRYHLYPDIALQTHLFPEVTDTEEPKAVAVPMDLIKIMDLQQEQMARSLGEGHRVVHGVAGSGKTMLLIYRCQFLASKQPDKPILVVCFNKALATHLRQIMQEKGVARWVKVFHFHGWCHDQIQTYRLSPPQSLTGEAYIDELVNTVILAVVKGAIPTGQYSAILVDEGHDFRPEWYKLLVPMVDPATNSLLILYDDAQNLYQTKRPKFSFRSVGIQAVGRTTVLRVNYRNTAEVLTLAYRFAQSVLEEAGETVEDGPVYVRPESVGRHGCPPVFVKLPRFQNEVQYVLQQCRQRHQEGVPWGDMAVLYRLRFMGTEVHRQFTKSRLPVTQLDTTHGYHNLAADRVKLLTMHASKGLEFPVVFLIGLGFMPNRHGTRAEEVRLLYVAMTRATHRLYLTGDRESEFVQQIGRLILLEYGGNAGDP